MNRQPASSETVEEFMFHHVNSKAMSTLHFTNNFSPSKFHLPASTTSQYVTCAVEGATHSFDLPFV